MVKRILLIQLRQLGDILLTTPCIKAVKQAHPRCELTFLSHKMGQLILEENPFLDEFFTYNPKDSLTTELRLARQLRERKYDLVIDFMNNPRSAFYSFATGAPTRIAFESARRWFYTDVVPRSASSDYIVREKFRLLAIAGYEASDERLILPWFEPHTGTFLKFFNENKSLGDSQLRIVMSPTHRREARRWPLVNYAALADWLVKEWQATITWIWGPGEQNTIDRVQQLCNVKTYRSPATTFRELAALIANHDLFIGNSNGPSHVAVAGNVPSLQLHGPTQAKAWCPFTDRHHGIQAPTSDISEITLDQVKQQLTEMRLAISTYAEGLRHHGPRLSWHATI